MNNLVKYIRDRFSDIKPSVNSIKRLMIVQVFFAVLLYLVLIANQLTNQYDGLWAGNYEFAGGWELSIGRWFWLYLDKLRFGISAEPVTSVMTIILICAGNVLIIDIFGLLENKVSYLICFLILSSTTLCNWLSYRYMSPTFAYSFISSVAAAWLLTRGIRYKARKLDLFICVVAALITATSLGAYQANIACTCVLILLYFIILMFDNREYKELLYRCMVGIFSLALGCIIYKVIWDILLKVYKTSAASYNGADSLSVSKMILAIPRSTVNCYSRFYEYFFKDSYKHNILQTKGVFFAAFALVLIAIILRKMAGGFKKLIIMLVILILLPAAGNASLYLATEAGFLIQMTGGMAIIYPCLLCVLAAGMQHGNLKLFEKIFGGLCIVCAAVVLYGNLYMITIDVEAMYEGKAATETIVSNVVSKLESDNMYDLNRQYIFIGRPSDNQSFRTTDIWYMANDYAAYGRFWVNCARMAYNGVLRNLGVNLTYGPDEEYSKLIQTDEVRSMPVYPNDGYIREIDGYVVIKISDTY